MFGNHYRFMRDNMDNPQKLPPVRNGEEGAPQPGDKKPRKWLSRVFNAAGSMALGASVSLAVKTAAACGLAAAGAPATVAAIAAAAAAGLVMGTIAAYRQHRKMQQDLQEKTSFFTRQNLFSAKTLKTVAFHTVFSAAGGALMNVFGQDMVDGLCKLFHAVAGTDAAVPPVPVVSAEPAVPAPVPDPIPEPVADAPAVDTAPPAVDPAPAAPEPSSAEKLLGSLADNAAGEQKEAMDALAKYIAANNVTDQKFLNLVESARSGNAQALKDLAAAINSHGKILCIDLPKDNNAVIQLYEAAMAKGNTQAMIDYAHLQFFGQTGVPKNPEAAIIMMKYVLATTDKGSKLQQVAKCFLDQWTDKFDGRACVTGVDCGPAAPMIAPAPAVIVPAVPAVDVPPPVADIPGAVEPDVTVDPVPVVTEPVVTQPEKPVLKDGLSCRAVIGGPDIAFICDLGPNGPPFQPGDKVIINGPDSGFVISPRP